VSVLCEIVSYLGGKVVEVQEHELEIDTISVRSRPIPRELTRKSTGSFLFAGALLARFGSAFVAHPGGDDLGPRPVDLHLDAFRSLGATVDERADGYAMSMVGPASGEVVFPARTVNGTVNAILAATRGEGTSVIRNAATEPDIETFIRFVNGTGSGCEVGVDGGNERINVRTARRKKPIVQLVVNADRNDAATFAIAAALCGDDVVLDGVSHAEIGALCDVLGAAGIRCEPTESVGALEAVVITRGAYRDLMLEVETEPYPGFSTDWGPLIQVLMSQIPGGGRFRETVFANRFAHVPELVRMGAAMTLGMLDGKVVDGSAFDASETYRTVDVAGGRVLDGQRVRAPDVRGGAALVLAGLVAKGTTHVENAYEVLRGYSNLAARLRKLGADVTESG
jgi:UDP-N-acetylglucosamine 1-carboxyvinyltransferase